MVATPGKHCYTLDYTRAIYNDITGTLQDIRKPLNNLLGFEKKQMKLAFETAKR